MVVAQVKVSRVSDRTETDISPRIPTTTVRDSLFSSTIMSPWTLSDVLGYISICCWLGAQFPSVKSSDCFAFHDVYFSQTNDALTPHRQPGRRKCAQEISRGPLSPVFG